MSRARAERRLLALSLLVAAGLPMAANAQEAAVAAAAAAETPVAAPPAPKADAQAKKADDNKMADRLRPTGPVTITATSVDWAKNGLMVYTGNVKLESDTLKLDGDKLELEQLGDGDYRAKIFGSPANLRHDAAPGADGAQDPPVTARAKQLFYDSRSGVVDLTSNARVTRGEDEMTGETIHYNVNERRIQAAGGSGGQVKIVIQPPAKGGGSSSTPRR